MTEKNTSSDFWKRAFLGLVIVVTVMACAWYVQNRFNEQQRTFNQALAANALTTNQALVEIRTQLADLEEAINSLDGQHSSDVSRIDVALRDMQATLDDHAELIQRNTNRYYDLNNDYWDLQQRVENLECAVWSEEDNCTKPQNPCGSCPYCGSPYCYYCGP